MNESEVYAYTGKILRIDLSSGTILVEPTIEYANKWLGGRGINLWILYHELKPWVTPYEPANKIVFGTGPLTGTLAPGACRLSVASKNVYSHGVGTANIGGFFAPELKFAGYDHIVIQGKAKTPVYLWIDDDQVALRDARSLWGTTTWETDDLIKGELGDEDIQILSIGPAGENLVRAACIIANRNRAGARCGLGAIMGSKNLKAAAVRGTGSVKVAYPDRFMEVVSDAWQMIESSSMKAGMGAIGLHSFFTPLIGRATPYKNFQDLSIPDELAKKLAPEVYQAKYQRAQIGYLSCPLHCSNFYRVDEGPYAGLATEGFEMNTSVDFGCKLALDYAPAIIKAHALCNQLGLDVDNTSGPIAWAFECYQRGILTKEDTDGLELNWGDYEAVFELVRKIAYREGFGNILAEGSKHASEIVGRGSDYYAMHIKGQDLYEDLRAPIGWAFGTCVATRGGGHTTSAAAADLVAGMNPEADRASREFFRVRTLDPAAYEDKAKLVVYTERQQEIMNSLILCLYLGTWSSSENLSLDHLAELYSAATGWETTKEELVKIADRILNVEKAFNVLHANLGRADDYPPERSFREPIKSGPLAGFSLSREKFDQMLDEYYQLRGWDTKSGLQTRKCLEELDLADVADDLKQVGKLADM